MAAFSASSRPSRIEDGVVGVEVAHALDHGLGLEFLEDVLADGVVDFRQRREVEIAAEEFDQTRAATGVERFQEVADIRLVHVGHERAHARAVVRLDGLGDRSHECRVEVALVVTGREKFGLATRGGVSTSTSCIGLLRGTGKISRRFRRVRRARQRGSSRNGPA